MNAKLPGLIEAAFEQRDHLTAQTASAEIKTAVAQTIALLDNGTLRVAEKKLKQFVNNPKVEASFTDKTGAKTLPAQDKWVVNQWIKKAVLLSFKLQPNRIMCAGEFAFYDKVEPKFPAIDAEKIAHSGSRIVPPALARYGSYLAPDVVMMPSYVNIGAYVDSGTMIDTWATVGSCAQIGKNVHLSGGVGIGGVLEPLQAHPTIIEDNCFIGARSEVVEGVIVETGSVISMGVFLGQSTKIYHRETGEISYGRIPAGSVVVSGSLPAKDSSHSLYCAVIVKTVDEKTRMKVGINELLRMGAES